MLLISHKDAEICAVLMAEVCPENIMMTDRKLRYVSMNLYNLFYLNPEWMLRIILAAGTGSLIGYERHNRSKEAGIGTHAIVCVAAAAITLVSKYGFDDTVRFDAARLAAQIISGISFLGAGIIFVRNESVQGLTTAAGIFTTAGIGICFGAGLCGLGLFTGLLVIVIQYILHHASYSAGLLFETRIYIKMKEDVTDISGVITKIRQHASNAGRIDIYQRGGHRVLETDLITTRESSIDTLLKEINTLPEVEKAELYEKQ